MKDIKLAVAVCLSIAVVTLPLHFAQAADTTSVIIKIKSMDNHPVLADVVNAKSKNNSVKSRLRQAKSRTSMVKQYADNLRVKPKNVYSHIYNGFSADVTPAQLKSLRNNPNVEVHNDRMLKTQRKKKLIEWPQILTNLKANKVKNI